MAETPINIKKSCSIRVQKVFNSCKIDAIKNIFTFLSLIKKFVLYLWSKERLDHVKEINLMAFF